MEVRRSSRLFIVDESGKLLLFEYHDEHHEPFWSTAGGELIEQENYIEAAIRELKEETGLELEIGELLKERDEVYAVARSAPARWLEQYFLINSPNKPILSEDGWSDEEKSTIQNCKWWSQEEMANEAMDVFKPDWLPELLGAVLNNRKNT